jgi:TRAP-type C4-dicarboxylate transport system permease small subunit
LILEIKISLLIYIHNFLKDFNSTILRIGRQLAWIAIFLMVVVILIQVFFRYILNNALPWPDELARFLMLWMTGFIAPSAYRWGGFVSIEMLPKLLPKLIENILLLILLSLSLFILIIGFQLGLQHIKIGWIFESSSIKIPFHLIGGEQKALKLAWMYMSLPVGIFLLILVNIELILRKLFLILKVNFDSPDDKDKESLGV